MSEGVAGGARTLIRGGELSGVGERAGVGRDSARAQSDGSGVYMSMCMCWGCVYMCACVRESLARAFRCVRAREKSIAPFDACNREIGRAHV